MALHAGNIQIVTGQQSASGEVRNAVGVSRSSSWLSGVLDRPFLVQSVTTSLCMIQTACI